MSLVEIICLSAFGIFLFYFTWKYGGYGGDE